LRLTLVKSRGELEVATKTLGSKSGKLCTRAEDFSQNRQNQRCGPNRASLGLDQEVA
jgi:hypothetical protein